MLKRFYVIAAIIGTLVPYYFVFQFIMQHGVNLSLFLEQWFANAVSSMGAVDLIISSFVFWGFAFVEARKLGIRPWWVCIPLNLFVGLSLALPLFLFWREQALEQKRL